KMIQINTENILFVCGGAFEDIDKIIERRLKTQSVGFKTLGSDAIDDSNYLQYISPGDVRSFGLIPEIIGRIPVICHLNPLDKSTLRSILTEPKNALIKQYKKIVEMEGVELQMDNEVIDLIVDKAFEYKLGARGLRSICESVMLDYMFNLPSQKDTKTLHITKDIAAERIEQLKLKSLKAA
ncbi:MAG: ATP-dependent Clp protease ATP-binding subunit ClpX, partial [Bacteroidota bacterium]